MGGEDVQEADDAEEQDIEEAYDEEDGEEDVVS
jgi:hypothetical protein